MIEADDLDALAAFVQAMAVDGLAGDELPPGEVLAIKFEYDAGDLSVVAFQMSNTAFGRGEPLRLAGGRSAMLPAGIPDQDRERCVETMRRTVLAAWRASRAGGPYRRGFFGVHDSIYMTDLDRGAEVVVDLDRLDNQGP